MPPLLWQSTSIWATTFTIKSLVSSPLTNATPSGKPFNLQEGSKILYTESEIQDYRNASIERLRDYARRYCMKCAKKLELKNYIPTPTCKPKDEDHSPYTLYENRDIIIEADECAVSPHILCLNCWEENKSQVKAMIRDKKILKEKGKRK